MEAGSQKKQKKTGKIVLFGNSGSGKSSIANLVSRKSEPPFLEDDGARSKTLKMEHRRSVIPECDIYDTPGLDIWGDDEVLEALRGLDGECKLCFVMSPRGGRMRMEDVDAMKRLMHAIETQTYYVIVNFCEDLSEDYKQRFMSMLKISCMLPPSLVDPADVLFLPRTPNLQLSRGALIQFVKKMNPRPIGTIAPVFKRLNHEERTLLSAALKLGEAQRFKSLNEDSSTILTEEKVNVLPTPLLAADPVVSSPVVSFSVSNSEWCVLL